MGKTFMKLGFTCGTFDLLHAGHLKMLEECKSKCNYLMVALQTDPTIDRPKKNKPVETLEERFTRLVSCKYVDGIIIYETEEDLYELLQSIKIDIRFIGEDWKGKKFTGHDLPIKIVYNKRKHNYSSTYLRKRIYGRNPNKTRY